MSFFNNDTKNEEIQEIIKIVEEEEAKAMQINADDLFFKVYSS